ncbi:MAG: hypothetical protein J6K32_00170 [Clostridia bacterium]|nr:hypothetical protein [Clostridia bacterium]
MAKEKSSRVHKRKRGCLGGCLVRIVLLLGLLALLFVGACVLGFVRNDPQTGAPSLSFEVIGLEDGQLSDLSAIHLGDLSGMLEGIDADSWPYAVAKSGLTVKTLRAGEGEAVLVCSDGYTMLIGGGSSGTLLCGQLLLCGAGRLDAALMLSCADEQAGGMAAAVSLLRPGYLLYPDSQTKSKAFNNVIAAAQKNGRTQLVAPPQGMSFSLGRAKVTVIGPAYRHHTDERDDGLSVRIDYGATSVLVMGGVTTAGEREIRSSGAPLRADVLICAQGGGSEATGADFVAAVSPRIALLTGAKPANPVIVRLQKAGAKVYPARDHGVMTVYSDGSDVRVVP